MHDTARILVMFLCFVTALQAQDKTEEAWRHVNAGVALLEQYSNEKAAVEFRAALELDPKLNAARINLAIALHHASLIPEALAEASKAAEAAPDSPHAHYLVALNARQSNDLPLARASFERVHQLDPTDTATRIHLARLCMEAQEFPRALELLTDAAEREPFNTTAVYNLGMTLQRLGRRDEAKPLLQRFQQLRTSGYATALGTQYLEAGRYAAAVTADARTQPFAPNGASVALTVPEALRGAVPACDAAKPAAKINLADIDADGDEDALLCGPDGARVWLNTAGSFKAGAQLFDAATYGALAGDMNADGANDIVLLTAAGAHILCNGADGFVDATAQAGFPAALGHLHCGALADVDHDGDLDILLGTSEGVQLLRNNGDGTFLDITANAGVGNKEAVHAIAASDLDNGRDIDLVLALSSGARIAKNRRDGTFAATALGTPAQAVRVLAIGDSNKDGFEDLFLGGEAAAERLQSNGRGGYSTVSMAIAHSDTALFTDIDNDGWLDLLVLADGRVLWCRGAPAGLQAPAILSGEAPLATRAMAAADIDGDGDSDIVCADASAHPQVLLNSVTPSARALELSLTGRVSNRSGFGTKIDLRAGSLTQKLETGSSFPPNRPAVPHCGLGNRTQVDAVRLLWPSGNVQAELPTRTTPLHWKIEEVDRKPSSCPNLYTWNGHQFQFITDFMGGGEMGAWVEEGLRNSPDPEEYVRIPPGALVPRNGFLELRVTNELEEALFIDHLSLLAVDHPSGIHVFPNEGMSFVAPRPWQLHALSDLQSALRVTDAAGREHTDSVAVVDRSSAAEFFRTAIRGFSTAHWLQFEFATIPEHPVLLLSGWTDYAFSSDTRRAQQAGLQLNPPSLEAQQPDGSWRVVESDIGIPVGSPQSYCVDLHGKLHRGVTRLRLSTNMCVHWDRIALAQGHPELRPQVSRALPHTANLAWRGYSGLRPTSANSTGGFDYARVACAAQWKTFAGFFTRFGEVNSLLDAVDDIFVVSASGDEIALQFREQDFPALRAGWTRTWMLHADGFSKEMDPNSATPDSLLPLPFHGMSRYPYGSNEHFPMTPEREAIMRRYNTRHLRSRIPAAVQAR